MTDDDPSMLAAGHALGSLTPDERAAYQAHLARSADARGEASAFGAVAAALGHERVEEAPPAALKDRLMAQIAVTPQRTADAVGEVGAQAGPAPVPAVPAAAPAVPAQAEPFRPRPAQDRAHSRWFRRPGLILAAAAAAVVLFVGGTAVGIAVGNAGSPGQNQQQEAATLAQISAAPDAQRASREVTGGGAATLIWSATLGKSAVVLDGLPPAPAGKTYQLWYIGSGSVVSAGLVAAHQDAKTWQVLDGSMTAGDTVGITIEPAGGSKAPTSKPIVAIAS